MEVEVIVGGILIVAVLTVTIITSYLSGYRAGITAARDMLWDLIDTADEPEEMGDLDDHE